MSGASLLTLLDDIAAVLDDVALMSKVAARKTAGVLGDDLALNVQQVTGVAADRELPVVWGVAKGSLVNKAILVPAALLISALAPFLVTPLLMLGGLYLCFEGVEKLWHSWCHKKEEAEEDLPADIDLKAYEKEKIKGAVRTDFILSAEIIAITLGIVADASFMTQLVTLCIIAVVMTAGVYGLVAAIVKLDDAGFYLVSRKNVGEFGKWLGNLLLAAAPVLMKLLAVVGTLAMFMVGGGILVHGIRSVSAYFAYLAGTFFGVAFIGPVIAYILPTLLAILFGVVAGIAALLLVLLLNRLRRGSQTH
ncbi:MAG: DUF808 domain-containing protein [Shewanella sp.]|nr:DUF808 domain-containing protein [Shewanella sp.]MCF1429895.1 DUF808 domain-containing protein [Shewanella sp.]MCF1437690.1 DUF808 domain-containing protein [Shewanella sp.]MCF1457782.1 DUF808 domain-containing protein [Shewanella sp.]